MHSDNVFCRMFKSGASLRINLRCQLQPTIWCVSGYTVASLQCTVCHGNDVCFDRSASSKGKDQQGFCDGLQEIAWCTNQRLSRYAISYEPSTAPIAAGPITWAKPCAAGQHPKSSHQVLLEDVLRTPRSGSGADLWAPVLDERHGTSLGVKIQTLPNEARSIVDVYSVLRNARVKAG